MRADRGRCCDDLLTEERNGDRLTNPLSGVIFRRGTDYPAYYLQHGGKVVGAAINKYCYLSVRRLPPFFSHKHRIVYSRTELVNSIDQIQHPSVRETMRYRGIDYGISVHHDGDMPAHSGMGSSSAFTVGLLNSLHALENQMISKRDLARGAIHVEQSMIRENVGSQDQTLSAYGGLNVVDFMPNGEIVVSPVIMRPEVLQDFESRLLLVFTGHSAAPPRLPPSSSAPYPTSSRRWRG
jgi:D-glycero-alpha-D-manno-heptose-7-phosphate kinase